MKIVIEEEDLKQFHSAIGVAMTDPTDNRITLALRKLNKLIHRDVPVYDWKSLKHFKIEGTRSYPHEMYCTCSGPFYCNACRKSFGIGKEDNEMLQKEYLEELNMLRELFNRHGIIVGI